MSKPRLNRLLALEQANRAPDGAGGYVQVWEALGTVWADIRAGTGREQGQDFVTMSTVPYRITVRATPEGSPSRPKPDQRFREGARVFRIIAVTETYGELGYLTCFAREEVAA